MPFSCDRSDAREKEQSRNVMGSTLSGERSATLVQRQENFASRVPFSGDRSANFPFPGSLPSQDSDCRPANVRTGEISVTASVQNPISVTTPLSILGERRRRNPSPSHQTQD